MFASPAGEATPWLGERPPVGGASPAPQPSATAYLDVQRFVIVAGFISVTIAGLNYFQTDSPPVQLVVATDPIRRVRIRNVGGCPVVLTKDGVRSLGDLPDTSVNGGTVSPQQIDNVLQLAPFDECELTTAVDLYARVPFGEGNDGTPPASDPVTFDGYGAYGLVEVARET